MKTEHKEPESTVFRYTKPAFESRKKKVTLLARTDRVFCAVQSVREGGENNLHSHTDLDGIWFVLRGEARFYSSQGVIADLGPDHGILIPRGFPYWFESIGSSDLEIFQVEASGRELGDDIGADRVNHEQLKEASYEAQQDRKAESA